MHSVDTPWIRYSFGTFGMIAATIILGVSMAANYRYGYTLARTPTDGQIYALGAAAADVIMALCPFFFFGALDSWHESKGRAFTQAVASFILWLAFTLFAFQAVVSHASANRLDAASTRTVTANSYADTRAELEQARKDRKFIPEHRPADTVRAELEKHKTNRIWLWSTECNEKNTKAARDFCAQYHTLNAELGYGLEATRLDKRIQELTAKSDRASEVSATVAASEADPGAKTWALLANVDLRTMQGIITFGFAGVILLGAGLGHYASSTMFRSKRRRMIVVDADTATRADVKEATKELLALAPPKAKVLPEIIVRPDPSPEARALLTAIDFPVKALRGPLRQRDGRDVLPWRFLLWLRAHDIEGEHESSKLEAIYLEYAQADHREPWSWRIVGSEITTALGYYKVPRILRKEKDGVTRTYYAIRLPALDKLREALTKKGVLKEPEPPAGPKKKGSILSFPLASAGAPEPKATPEKSGEKAPLPEPIAKARGRVAKGFAELSRFQPDLESMRAMVRAQKAAFRDRVMTMTRDRKQGNRHRRSRAA